MNFHLGIPITNPPKTAAPPKTDAPLKTDAPFTQNPPDYSGEM